jgi:hypothetical protein
MRLSEDLGRFSRLDSSGPSGIIVSARSIPTMSYYFVTKNGTTHFVGQFSIEEIRDRYSKGEFQNDWFAAEGHGLSFRQLQNTGAAQWVRLEDLMLIKCSCPSCGQHILVDSAALGQQAACPTCSTPFVITDSSAAAVPSPPSTQVASVVEAGDARKESVGEVHPKPLVPDATSHKQLPGHTTGKALCFTGGLGIFVVILVGELAAEGGGNRQSLFLAEAVGVLLVLAGLRALAIFNAHHTAKISLFHSEQKPMTADANLMTLRAQIMSRSLARLTTLGMALCFSLIPVGMAHTYGSTRPIFIPVTIVVFWIGMLVMSRVKHALGGFIVGMGIMLVGLSAAGINPEAHHKLDGAQFALFWSSWILLPVAVGGVSGAILAIVWSSVRTLWAVVARGKEWRTTQGRFTLPNTLLDSLVWIIIAPVLGLFWLLLSFLALVSQFQAPQKK